MDALQEMFRYHQWAAVQLLDYCTTLSPANLQQQVLGADRSIAHMLTHLVGTEQPPSLDGWAYWAAEHSDSST